MHIRQVFREQWTRITCRHCSQKNKVVIFCLVAAAFYQENFRNHNIFPLKAQCYIAMLKAIALAYIQRRPTNYHTISLVLSSISRFYPLTMPMVMAIGTNPKIFDFVKSARYKSRYLLEPGFHGIYVIQSLFRIQNNMIIISRHKKLVQAKN